MEIKAGRRLASGSSLDILDTGIRVHLACVYLAFMHLIASRVAELSKLEPARKRSDAECEIRGAYLK